MLKKKEIRKISREGQYTEQKYKHNAFIFAPIFYDLNSKT